MWKRLACTTTMRWRTLRGGTSKNMKNPFLIRCQNCDCGAAWSFKSSEGWVSFENFLLWRNFSFEVICEKFIPLSKKETIDHDCFFCCGKKCMNLLFLRLLLMFLGDFMWCIIVQHRPRNIAGNSKFFWKNYFKIYFMPPTCNHHFLAGGGWIFFEKMNHKPNWQLPYLYYSAFDSLPLFCTLQ